MSPLDALIRFGYDNFSSGVPALPHFEVEEFRARANLSPGAFFDCFARRVAHDYFAAKMSFEVADIAMTSLNSYCLFQYDVSLPSYAQDVYVAFDQGEFKHTEDDASVDPEMKYTRPEIQALAIRDQILGLKVESA